MSSPLKDYILQFDARLTGLKDDMLRRKEVFIHGDFSYWGFFKENVHLFLVLGIFGALAGYLNTFIEREVPFNVYAGKLGITQTPVSMIPAFMDGHSPLSTPFPPADLLFGITCSYLLFTLIALAILWAAVNFKDAESHSSSEFKLAMRVSFIALFGSLIVIFISYMIRNYGLLVQALAEALSAFAAVYVIAFLLKHVKKPIPWLLVFVILGTLVYIFKVYVPALTIFSIALGLLSLTIFLVLAPFLAIKGLVGHIKERHLQ
jgi:hypothetical protein